jgi:hypothetical protein
MNITFNTVKSKSNIHGHPIKSKCNIHVHPVKIKCNIHVHHVKIKCNIHVHQNELFNKKVFAWSIAEGIVTSIVLFFIPYGAFHDGLSTSGSDMADSQAYGVVVASILVVAVNLRVNMFTL